MLVQELTIPVTPTLSLSTTISSPEHASPDTPALLLLHFWGGSNRTWSPLIAALCHTAITIGPSLRGWGTSQPTATTDTVDTTTYTLADSTNDILTLLTFLTQHRPDLHLATRPLYVLGHSMGAKLVASLLPALVGASPSIASSPSAAWTRPPAGLILVAPAPPGPVCLPSEEMRTQQIAAYDDVGAAEAAVRHVLLGRPDGVSDEVVRGLVEDAVRGASGAKRAWPEEGMGRDLEGAVGEAVREWKGRVLVVVGERDRVERWEVVKEKVVGFMREKSARVEVEVLDGVGHLIPVEAVGRLAERVKVFLDEA